MGLEAAVKIPNPEQCPVADVSAEADARVGDVSWSGVPNDDDSVTEEFELDTDADPPDDMEKVFGDNRYSIYRFDRADDAPCICQHIETFGCPVADVEAVDGSLRIVFRPADVESLQEIVGTLQREFGGIQLEHLVQSSEPTEGETVVVDRGRLTDRQREVLETAYEMGYFEHPKGANAGEVADELGINSATLRGHLSAAQSKLLDEMLA